MGDPFNAIVVIPPKGDDANELGTVLSIQIKDILGIIFAYVMPVNLNNV